jgi:hypothetical protein
MKHREGGVAVGALLSVIGTAIILGFVSLIRYLFITFHLMDDIFMFIVGVGILGVLGLFVLALGIAFIETGIELIKVIYHFGE